MSRPRSAERSEGSLGVLGCACICGLRVRLKDTLLEFAAKQNEQPPVPRV